MKAHLEKFSGARCSFKKKGNALELPTSYVDIDRDEMEYVDGGWDIRTVMRNALGMTAVAGLEWCSSAIY